MSARIHALIVDDERPMRLAIRGMLSTGRSADFQFDEAADGNEALRKFDPKRTDLVFLDWNLPGLSGLAVLYRIRALATCRRVRVIMVTGEARHGKIEEALDEAGADAYLVKPFSIEELHRPVLKLLEEIAAERQQTAPQALISRFF